MDVLFNSVMTNRKFLYSAFYAYDNQMVIDFFEQAGLPVKNERGNRIFPVSDHSSDVIAALQRVLKKDQVEIRLHSEVDTPHTFFCSSSPESSYNNVSTSL